MDAGQSRVMLGLAGALSVVAVGLWLEGEVEAPGDPDATAAVWSIDPEEVTRVEVTRAGAVFALVRAEDGWWIDGAEPLPADPERVRGLLRAFADMDDGVPVTGGAPADYGLEPPRAEVAVTLGDGPPQRLAVGDAAPVGWRTYVQTTGGAVVAVQGRVGDDPTQPVALWRDRRVAHFDPAQVRAVTLRGPEGVLTVRGEGSAWWVDGYTRADPDAVDDLVMGLLALRFDALQDPSPAGVAPAPRAVVVTFADGTTWEAQAGVPDGDTTPLDVVGGPSGTVLTEALALLSQGPADLGDARAIPFEADAGGTVAVLAADGRAVTLTANRGAWAAPGVDAAAVTAAVRALTEAQIVWSGPPPAALGPVEARLRLRPAQGAPRELEIGPADETFRRVRDVDGGAPYRVPVAELAPVLALLSAGDPSGQAANAGSR